MKIKHLLLGIVALTIFFSQSLLSQAADFGTGLHTRGQVGNLVYDSVHLDGRNLFQIAEVKASTDEEDKRGTGPLQVRIARIENRLRRLLESQERIEPQQIQVSQLNDQYIVSFIAEKGSESLTILTVTNLDAEIYGLPETVLSKYYAEKIYEGLALGYLERQPNYIPRKLLRQGIVIVGVAAFASVLFFIWEKRNQRRQVRLRKKLAEIAEEAETIDPQANTAEAEREEALKQSECQYEQQLENCVAKERVLQFTQIVLWLLAIATVLRLFPQTRSIGISLTRQPIWIVITWLAVTGGIYVSHLFTNYLLEIWVDRGARISAKIRDRRQKRLPTLSFILNDLETKLLILVGIITTFQYIKVFSRVELLSGVGAIGLAASIGFRSALNDAISGTMLLLKDVFTEGDIITIGDDSGAVESMGLLMTQLRAGGGELITLRNGTISSVQNKTREWSRLYCKIDVAYDTDVDIALKIMGQVFEEISREEEWQEYVLEEPDILAVDNLAHGGVTLLIRAKTVAMKQWGIGREYRRRLKQRFTEAGIEIGRPQQVVMVRSTSSSESNR